MSGFSEDHSSLTGIESRVHPAQSSAALVEAQPPFTSTGPEGHRGRMRARLLAHGADSLADYEILEMLLFLGIPRRDTKPLAKGLINRFGSLAGVLEAAPAGLAAYPGLDGRTAAPLGLVRIAAARLGLPEARDRPVLNSWARLGAYLDSVLARPDRARTRVLFLNNRNQLLADEAQEEQPDPALAVRRILKRALALHASALFLLRAAEAEQPSAAAADLALTARLDRAAEMLSLVLHDTVILGRERWVSLKARPRPEAPADDA